MIRVGDRAPKFLRFRVQSGSSGVDLSTCDEIRIRVTRPSGGLLREVALTSIVATPSEASGLRLFDASGAEWPEATTYYVRVFALSAGAWLLDYETTIGVEPTKAGWLGT
jgi:hypothetical protein